MLAVNAWWRSLEITRGRDGKFHPHLHVLIFFKPEYFDRRAGLYIDQANREWAKLWAKAYGADGPLIVDIRKARGIGKGHVFDGTSSKTLHELCKYLCKPDALVSVDEDGHQLIGADALAVYDDGDGARILDNVPLLALHNAVHGRRLIGMSKSLRDISDELSINEFEASKDFHGDRELPDNAVYLGREFYEWVRGKRSFESTYVLRRFEPFDPVGLKSQEVGMSTVKSC
jgi:hypothetical protein